ncbi:hypothetical protein [uncultured Paraglaciecola sp.]|uniref:hypothetical protein n=1 Tax=uncultured Paraglaciecola sp. TaxID=1765024 RepID=UPI002605A784|nr:hypothetical protein [uncultured Paraglaciecola sp.]
MAGIFTGTFGLVLFVVALIVFIMWIFLPIAVSGIQKKVKLIADNSEEGLKTNKAILLELKKLNNTLDAADPRNQ